MFKGGSLKEILVAETFPPENYTLPKISPKATVGILPPIVKDSLDLTYLKKQVLSLNVKSPQPSLDQSLVHSINSKDTRLQTDLRLNPE